MTTDFSVFVAARQLGADLTTLDSGTNSEEVISYFMGQLTEAARKWLNNIENIRSYGADLQRDITRTLGRIGQGYGIDTSNRLGQRADDYNAAVMISRDLANSVQQNANTIWNALGRKDEVQALLEAFIETLFGSVKVAQ